MGLTTTRSRWRPRPPEGVIYVGGLGIVAPEALREQSAPLDEPKYEVILNGEKCHVHLSVILDILGLTNNTTEILTEQILQIVVIAGLVNKTNFDDVKSEDGKLVKAMARLLGLPIVNLNSDMQCVKDFWEYGPKAARQLLGLEHGQEIQPHDYENIDESQFKERIYEIKNGYKTYSTGPGASSLHCTRSLAKTVFGLDQLDDVNNNHLEKLYTIKRLLNVPLGGITEDDVTDFHSTHSLAQNLFGLQQLHDVKNIHLEELYTIKRLFNVPLGDITKENVETFRQDGPTVARILLNLSPESGITLEDYRTIDSDRFQEGLTICNENRKELHTIIRLYNTTIEQINQTPEVFETSIKTFRKDGPKVARIILHLPSDSVITLEDYTTINSVKFLKTLEELNECRNKLADKKRYPGPSETFSDIL